MYCENIMEEGLRLIERESSIENEPRTLNIHQIHLARELARHVMNTKSIQEASTIFTQVSEPVVRRAAKSRFESVRAAINDEEDNEYNESCIFYDIIRIRDIVSAPF